MDKTKLISILSMKETILSMQELVEINQLVIKYPYCSIFWVLGAKISDIINSYNKEEWLTKAATFTYDREYLKKTILQSRETIQRAKELEKMRLEAESKMDIMQEIDAYKEEGLSENPTKEELINRFLKIENPKVNNKEEDSTEEVGNIDKVIRNSASDDYRFVTETMAKIYLKQGNKDKAIQIYQRLMASNPKKSVYFANQIEKIKNS